MQLTAFTDLGLRIVMRLAVLDAEQTATTRALAGELNVPATHAAKVVTRLGRLGVVDARRGRSGGLRLADGARDLSVGFVARELEGDGEVVECEGPNPCPLRGGCRLRGALARAREAFFAALDPMTIADVSAAPTRDLLLTIGTRPPG
ncbi:RrF2 family transcriptional regulator [Krasilnikoviella flava]|uniref:Transcriptional regulator, BadM/Rrf2 family n=1 Tax=Krasilnikoviella flava TaxID=526729 RepID=A0A1T5LP44_9MICO|nr:Rrf2 family transcriptional regulator [Krasilnikoviella flava]SKC77722.1 transcriptional regulator, BadM/Rrf2 family [Krasilnikoviella flava]